MSYVAAAWISCAGLLGAYIWRTLRRERSLRRALASDRPAVPSQLSPGPRSSQPADARLAR